MVLSIILAIENEDDRNLMLYLYSEFYGIFKSKAYGIIKDYMMAEDIVQDAVIKMMDRMPKMRGLTKPQAVSYACRTVNSVAIDYYRKHIRGTTKEVLSVSGNDEFTDTSQSPPEIYERLEEYEKLGEALLQLSERDKDLIYNKYFLGLSDREIGLLLEMEHTNVRVSLNRARNRAKNILTKMSGDNNA